MLTDWNNQLLPLTEDSRCLYIQYIFLLDDVRCQMHVWHLLIMEMELFEGAEVAAHFCCMVQAPCVFSKGLS